MPRAQIPFLGDGMRAVGRSLELYFIDGRPDGMLTAKMFNWNGQLLVVPRTQLATALTRNELNYAGVYLLLGEQDGESKAYIGESETVGTRIKQHDVNKDWWTQAIFVTTTGNELNKAHVRYLEARMIQTAAKVGRIPLTNGTAPPLPGLSEADIGKMEMFLDNLFLALPAVRVDLFLQLARPKPLAAPQADAGTAPAISTEAPRFVLTAKKYGLKATALLSDGEFIVEAGSLARSSWQGIGADAKSLLYEQLRRANVIQPQGDHCVFIQNYAFKSPSAAATIVTGRSANGTTEWRTEAGQTYKDWEREALGLT